jgi:gamma-glutamyl:cysteine ligase YbdK (ATP-grasp superfamily)
MGKKIEAREFDKMDFDEFLHRLEEETCLLEEWIRGGVIAKKEKESGFELELWLLDAHFRPKLDNLNFIETLGEPFLVTEAVQSCLEINVPYDTLHNSALSRHEKNLTTLLAECRNHAKQRKCHIISVGTLPTADENDFTELTITNENRYQALNLRFNVLSEYKATHLSITGMENLDLSINNFALAGAISAFQIHFRIGLEQSKNLYNVSLALSAPIVALAANSPFVFGRRLWEETRIPFYEQIIPPQYRIDSLPRVTFGTGYLKDSILELFIENHTKYGLIIPQVMNGSKEEMQHLQLHNGNIYRWNRPVLGFNEAGKPHFRIEHRPLSSGPSVIDMMANAAFYFGITNYYLSEAESLQEELPFYAAESNFYQAAKYGLFCEVYWRKGVKLTISDLIVEILLPQAKIGLLQLDINATDVDYYLSIVEERVRKKQNGSVWQKKFFNQNDHDYVLLVKTYLELQEKGRPVHEWPIK